MTGAAITLLRQRRSRVVSPELARWLRARSLLVRPDRMVAAAAR